MIDRKTFSESLTDIVYNEYSTLSACDVTFDIDDITVTDCGVSGNEGSISFEFDSSEIEYVDGESPHNIYPLTLKDLEAIANDLYSKFEKQSEQPEIDIEALKTNVMSAVSEALPHLIKEQINVFVNQST